MSLEGEIGEIVLVERLVELGQEKFTGAIRFENDGIIKIVYFKGGDILSASTNDRSDTIDEILLRAGKVTREHVKQALAKRKESETLGDALLALGFITRKELTWARRVQVIGVIRSVAAWESGSFTIVSDYLPKREEGTLFPLRPLLLELIVTEQDRPKFDRAMDGGNAVFEKSEGFHDEFAGLGLNEEAEQIAGVIDGHRSAADVASASGKDSFNVYKLLHALKTLHLLRPAIVAQAVPEFSFDSHNDLASAGIAGAADMWSRPEQPSFQFDDAAPEYAPEPPMTPVDPVIEQSTAMPGWEAPPSSHTIATSLPVSSKHSSSPLPEPAGGWGFDEAQLETARRASSMGEGGGATGEEQVSNRWTRILISSVLLALLAAGSYGGWKWWKGRQNAVAAANPNTPVRRSVSSRASAPPFPAGTRAAVVPVDGRASSGQMSRANPAQTTGGLPGSQPSVTSSGMGPEGDSERMGVHRAEGAPKPSGGVTARTAASPAAPAKPYATAMEPARQSSRPTSQPAEASSLVRSGTGLVSTNAASGAKPSSSPEKARYDAMAEQNARAASGNYTVQFELVCETASVTKALAVGAGEVWFVPTKYRGRSCYRVFWGHYDTHEAASAGAGRIPASLREAAPVIVRVPK